MSARRPLPVDLALPQEARRALVRALADWLAEELRRTEALDRLRSGRP